MEVQLEKRRKLDADISSQPGVDKMEHKKISELEEKIAELEKNLHLKEIQEIAHVKKISKLEDSLKAVEKVFLKGLESYHDKIPYESHGRIGPKDMSMFYLHEDEYHELCEAIKGSPDDFMTFDDFTTFWEARVRKPDFDASTCVDDGEGNMKYIIREDHEELNQVRKSYGDLVFKAVCNAHLQFMEWGDDTVLWDYEEDRKATVLDVLEHCYLEIYLQPR